MTKFSYFVTFANLKLITKETSNPTQTKSTLTQKVPESQLKGCKYVTKYNKNFIKHQEKNHFKSESKINIEC